MWISFTFTSSSFHSNWTWTKQPSSIRNPPSVGAYVNTLDMFWEISINGDWRKGCGWRVWEGITKTGGKGSNWEFNNFVLLLKTLLKNLPAAFRFFLYSFSNPNRWWLAIVDLWDERWVVNLWFDPSFIIFTTTPRRNSNIFLGGLNLPLPTEGVKPVIKLECARILRPEWFVGWWGVNKVWKSGSSSVFLSWERERVNDGYLKHGFAIFGLSLSYFSLLIKKTAILSNEPKLRDWVLNDCDLTWG